MAIATVLSGALVALLLVGGPTEFNDWPAPPDGRQATLRERSPLSDFPQLRQASQKSLGLLADNPDRPSRSTALRRRVATTGGTAPSATNVPAVAPVSERAPAGRWRGGRRKARSQARPIPVSRPAPTPVPAPAPRPAPAPAPETPVTPTPSRPSAGTPPPETPVTPTPSRPSAGNPPPVPRPVPHPNPDPQVSGAQDDSDRAGPCDRPVSRG